MCVLWNVCPVQSRTSIQPKGLPEDFPAVERPVRACPNRTSVKDACSCPTRVACAITDTYPRGSWSSTDSLRSTDGPGSALAFRELKLCPERVVVAVGVDILAVGMGLRYRRAGSPEDGRVMHYFSPEEDR
jgi:hypothetical protein